MNYLITMTRDAKQTITAEVVAESLEEAIEDAREMEQNGDLPIESEDIEGNGEWDVTGEEV